eukprot:Awhi_evm2s75
MTGAAMGGSEGLKGSEPKSQKQEFNKAKSEINAKILNLENVYINRHDQEACFVYGTIELESDTDN